MKDSNKNQLPEAGRSETWLCILTILLIAISSPFIILWKLCTDFENALIASRKAIIKLRDRILQRK